MDVIQTTRNYLLKMVRSTLGMKVLLLDKETTGIVSLISSPSEMAQEEVYQFEDIRNQNRTVVAHLNAIVFVRPTEENIRLLQEELRAPKYGHYYLFFSNTVSHSYLNRIAADEHDVVVAVQEYFADYFAINKDFFSLNLKRTLNTSQYVKRIEDGIFSVLLSLKLNPYIRTHNSNECKQIGNNINNMMNRNEFKQADKNSVLVILNRREDPITPLINSWSYQSILHELIGIDNNILNFKSKESQILISPNQDSFYKDNMFKNYGNICNSLKELADLCKKNYDNNKGTMTIAEIKTFVKTFDTVEDQKDNFDKHWLILEKLRSEITEQSLFDISKFEQNLIIQKDKTKASGEIEEFISNNKISNEAILRLVILYSLYFSNNDIQRYLDVLSDRGVSEDDLMLVNKMSVYSRLNTNTNFSVGKNILDIKYDILKSITGVSNIYKQHKPLLKQTLCDIINGSLDKEEYPYISNSSKDIKPLKVIVFIVGGVTYSEAKIVNNTNSREGINIILGGTTVHNTASFLSEVKFI